MCQCPSQKISKKIVCVGGDRTMSKLNYFVGGGGGNLDNVQVRQCPSWTMSKLKNFCVCGGGGVTRTIFCLRYPGQTYGH